MIDSTDTITRRRHTPGRGHLIALGDEYEFCEVHK
jgi:hypothetical protein